MNRNQMADSQAKLAVLGEYLLKFYASHPPNFKLKQYRTFYRRITSHIVPGEFTSKLTK